MQLVCENDCFPSQLSCLHVQNYFQINNTQLSFFQTYQNRTRSFQVFYHNENSIKIKKMLFTSTYLFSSQCQNSTWRWCTKNVEFVCENSKTTNKLSIFSQKWSNKVKLFGYFKWYIWYLFSLLHTDLSYEF